MKERSTLDKKFQVIKFFDDCRWNKENNNYGTINYAHDNLTEDQKLLTHWLCYITDRQMSFEMIWDVGGFVFSDMVKAYQDNGAKVLEINGENSFFVNNKEKGDNDYCFRSNKTAGQNNILKNYGYRADTQVTFVSRFYSSDYMAMLYTLKTLESYDRSFAKYIGEIIKKVIEATQDYTAEDLIRGIVYGFYLLSYDQIGQPKKEELQNISRDITRNDLPKDSKTFVKDANHFFDVNKRYENKRVWCCIRDYIKSMEFGECFRKALNEKGVDNCIIDKIFSDEAKKCLELPGDVWNNNSKFRNCMISDSEMNELEKLSNKEKNEKRLNKLLRTLYEKKETSVYPEQFDVTFSFVPRMCAQNRCDVCPLGALKSENANKITKLCVNNTSKYCTIAMMCCGYKCNCQGDDCELRKLLFK